MSTLMNPTTFSPRISISHSDFKDVTIRGQSSADINAAAARVSLMREEIKLLKKKKRKTKLQKRCKKQKK